jgi:hypothetical protein
MPSHPPLEGLPQPPLEDRLDHLEDRLDHDSHVSSSEVVGKGKLVHDLESSSSLDRIPSDI